VHYGFTCSFYDRSPSPDDGIKLDHLIIPKLEPNIRDQLQDVGFLGNYTLASATGELCFKTEVAVRAALLSSNEWEYFISNGEDLGDDKSPQVRTYVKQTLNEYRNEVFQVMHRIDDIEDSDVKTAKILLDARYEQILDAIARFEQV
jgi:hypothetical protein